ncbi:uncharacterized protein LOC130827773 [Amaranthus tricolor]|uniref:uncharacterized protein LOC130827773 n=1 Tax=Amaranthus tricolor TaxID=29722 RepID=UPI00258BE76C|nr:uncharacterized protein LOC130827773 [Amaranthus tricolor]
MADEVTLVDATNDTTFPPVEIDGELNPGNNTEFHVDSVSSQLDKGPTKQRKPKAKKQCPKNDPMQAFKTTIIVSGIVLAVAGAIFAITKKLKEK